MPSTSDLREAVQRNDHTAFLRNYMMMVLEGDNLSVPGSLEAEKSKTGWEDILTGLAIPYTDDFLSNMNRYWLSVVKKQGGKITEKFSQEILDIINNKAPSNTKIQMPSKTDVPGIPEDSHSDTVVLRISNDYYKHSLLHAERPTHKDDIDKLILEAVSKGQIENFLKHYLSYTQVDIKPLVPLSTVLGVISDRWEDIIMREYGLVPDPGFLSKLSVKWFYLVNLKGIPINLAKLSELYVFLATKEKPKTAPKSKSVTPKKSFFQRLFGS